jgi:hypothetical protein
VRVSQRPKSVSKRIRRREFKIRQSRTGIKHYSVRTVSYTDPRPSQARLKEHRAYEIREYKINKTIEANQVYSLRRPVDHTLFTAWIMHPHLLSSWASHGRRLICPHKGQFPQMLHADAITRKRLTSDGVGWSIPYEHKEWQFLLSMKSSWRDRIVLYSHSRRLSVFPASGSIRPEDHFTRKVWKPVAHSDVIYNWLGELSLRWFHRSKTTEGLQNAWITCYQLHSKLNCSRRKEEFQTCHKIGV